ncbi:MAG: hypothetical protein AAGK78_01730, partial [Planctomycetota bacterium]
MESLEPRRLLAGLDPSFGDEGIALMNRISVGNNRAYAIAELGDGDVLISTDFQADTRPHLLRFNSDGTADTAWADEGLSKIDELAGPVVAMKPSGDGLMVLASDSVHGPTLALLDGDGHFDRVVARPLTPPGSSSSGTFEALDFITLPGGELLVFSNHSMTKLDASGATITSFGINGVRSIGHAHGVTVDDAGRILVASGSTSGEGLVARYLPDGNLDASFGTGGFFDPPTPISTDPWRPHWSRMTGVAVGPDGRIFTVGYAARATGSQLFAAVATDAGVSDTTWGDQGRVVLATMPRSNRPYADQPAVLSDGRLVVGISTRDQGERGVQQVIRLTPDGDFDTTFHGDGISASLVP